MLPKNVHAVYIPFIARSTDSACTILYVLTPAHTDVPFTCGGAVVIVPRDPLQFHTFALVFRQYQVLRCIGDV